MAPGAARTLHRDVGTGCRMTDPCHDRLLLPAPCGNGNPASLAGCRRTTQPDTYPLSPSCGCAHRCLALVCLRQSGRRMRRLCPVASVWSHAAVLGCLTGWLPFWPLACKVWPGLRKDSMGVDRFPVVGCLAAAAGAGAGPAVTVVWAGIRCYWRLAFGAGWLAFPDRIVVFL